MELTDTQKSWITSSLSWSGVLGSALSVISTNKFGRKFTMLLWVIPAIITWLMISVATEPEVFIHLDYYYYFKNFIQVSFQSLFLFAQAEVE